MCSLETPAAWLASFWSSFEAPAEGSLILLTGRRKSSVWCAVAVAAAETTHQHAAVPSQSCSDAKANLEHRRGRPQTRRTLLQWRCLLHLVLWWLWWMCTTSTGSTAPDAVLGTRGSRQHVLHGSMQQELRCSARRSRYLFASGGQERGCTTTVDYKTNATAPHQA